MHSVDDTISDGVRKVTIGFNYVYFIDDSYLEQFSHGAGSGIFIPPTLHQFWFARMLTGHRNSAVCFNRRTLQSSKTYSGDGLIPCNWSRLITNLPKDLAAAGIVLGGQVFPVRRQKVRSDWPVDKPIVRSGDNWVQTMIVYPCGQ
jgi:hypothetical protein